MPDDDLPKPERRSQNEKFDDQCLRRYLLGQCSQIESDDLEQAVLLNGEIADLLSATEDELTEEYVENTLSETDLQCFIQRFRTRARVDKIVLTAKLLGRGELPEAFALLDRLRSGDDEVPIWQSGDFFRLPPVSAKDSGYQSELAELRSTEVPDTSEDSTPLKIPPFGTIAPASRSGRRFLSNWRFALGAVLVAGLSVAGWWVFYTTLDVWKARKGLAAQNFALDSTNGLQPQYVTVEALIYEGRKAVRVLSSRPLADLAAKSGDYAVDVADLSLGGIVVLQGTDFHNGTIEVDLAGKPLTGAAADARGFVGVAFRVSSDSSKYECFYIRPTNGGAQDQGVRNHSTQYISMPEYDSYRLGMEAPGQYESYVDWVPGKWSKIKIAVSGVQAALYVNDSPKAVLIVNDLKHGNTQGGVALWIGPRTEAYFANLRISHR